MTKLEQRFPVAAPVSVGELLAEMGDEPTGGRLRVGDPRVREFLVALARRLLAPATARRFPELASLGFFLRRGEIDKIIDSVTPGKDELRFPRGLVFHVPPANVDTIFVYSWALSALAGNSNVVRISPRSAGAATALVDALNATLADAHPAIAQTQRMVTFGHDDAAFAALSLGCDLRVIWGGDQAVSQIRRHPLRPSARDLTFPDRASFAVISTAGWFAADAEARRDVAIGLYNDSYWFDQAACASPRAIYWVGDAESVGRAQRELFALLDDVVTAKATEVGPAMAIEKRVSTYGLAAEGVANEIRFTGNAIATLDLTAPEFVPRRWLGVGTFPQARLESLTDMVGIVERRDQTVSHFGFAREELVTFAEQLSGRGVDRMVPIGAALAFSSTWDGYDLLREFTRLTVVQTKS
ncbi:acyl-CoA reductase [Dactylosporangium sp. NPDC000555]|uniref:acyl-CoA reductase n=1 Tax=Dactylosporangium sp. NPDC000555 TaxID=3154260 RepID=UPI003320B57A